MAPLEINVEGSSSIQRQAERGILTVTVSASGPSQDTVSDSVRSTANELQRILKELAGSTGSNTPDPNAPVTILTMTLLRTNSWISEDKDRNPLPRQYSVNTGFVATFRDFEKLGEIASKLFKMPHVTIDSVQWILTDANKLALGAETRKNALRDAISKAKDYSEVLGRKVVPTEIRDRGSTSRARTKMMMRQQRTANMSPSQGYVEGLELEAQDVEVTARVDVKFVAVDANDKVEIEA